MQRHQEAGEQKHLVYEKEVRRARKEAFKSSSTLVQMQEELKTARNRFTLMREGVEEHKRKVEARDEQILEAQSAQINLQQEVDELKQKLKLVEEERDTLKTSLKQEELAKIAAEGKIPLPPSTPDAEFASPKKKRTKLSPMPQKRCFSNKENQDPVDWYVYPEWMGGELQTLRDQVRGLDWAHKNALEAIDFMQVECQLKICPCRRAEAKGETYMYKPNLMEMIEQSAKDTGIPLGHTPKKQKKPLARSASQRPRDEDVVMTETAATENEDATPETQKSNEAEKPLLDTQVESSKDQTETEELDTQVESPKEQTGAEDEIVEFSPQTGTFRRISGMVQPLDSTPSSPQNSPSPRGRSPAPASLAPPLDPSSNPESPSMISVGDPESRPSDQGHRVSDECMVLPQSTPSTPQAAASPHAGSEETQTTPQARSFPSPLEFPPTPGADLTLTAPLNFHIPNHFAHPSKPHDAEQAIEDDGVDSFVADLQDEPLQTPTTPHGHPSLASPLAVPKTADARMNASTVPFDRAPSPPNLAASTNTRLVEHTTTVTIPLADPANSPKKFPYSPGASKTREEALESIKRWRKGRSQSVTARIGGTPRRVVSGVEVRRDISAPTPMRTKSRGA
jgi:hypothetical protein